MPSTISSSSAVVIPFEANRPEERRGFEQAREAWLTWRADNRISHADRGLIQQVYLGFNRQHYERTGELISWPGWDKIAAEAHLSKASIFRGFRRFERFGLLKIHRGGRDPKTGWKLPNSYTAIMPAPGFTAKPGQVSRRDKTRFHGETRLSEDRLTEKESKNKNGNPRRASPSVANLKTFSAEPCDVPRGDGGGGGGRRRYVAFDDPGWELVERWERGLSLTKRPMRAKGGGYWLTDDEWRQVQEVGS